MQYYLKISPQLSDKLNIARGVAAMLVMLGHLRADLFVPYGDLLPGSQGVINYVLFFITRIGHECVLIFFVLSGFLVGGQVVAEYNTGKFNIRRYFINRVTRMWIVLIPTLLFGLLVDYSSLSLDPTLPFGYKLTLPIFIGNIFFMQNIMGPSFGSNVPLWSIAYEFWYYVIFPIFFLLMVSRFSKIIKVIISIVLLIVISVIVPDIMKLFPVWLLGVMIRFIPERSILHKKIVSYSALVLLLLSILYSNQYNNLFANYTVGVSFAFNIIIWMYKISGIPPIIARASHNLANYSFSLYTIHNFLIIFLTTVLKNAGIGIRLAEANFTNWLIYIMLAILITFISYVFYLMFEKHTMKVRKLLSSLLLRPSFVKASVNKPVL